MTVVRRLHHHRTAEPAMMVPMDERSQRGGKVLVLPAAPDAIELRHLSQNAVRQGCPAGDARCEICRYYLDPTASISYCWHPKLRILVGDQWWCQWWEKIPEDG